MLGGTHPLSHPLFCTLFPHQLMEKLAALEAQLEHSVSEKARLEGEVEVCTQKLERAEKLIQVRTERGRSRWPWLCG